MGVGLGLKMPSLDYKLSIEDKLFFQKFGPMIVRLRRDPVLVARLIHGINVPPHQRRMLKVMWMGFQENHLIGSRGTAKSASWSSIGQVVHAETHFKLKYMSLSASKFRGGKLILEEADDFISGRFQGQKIMPLFSRAAIRHENVIKRESDRWFIPFTTRSTITTIPTGNVETARGYRANRLVLDEADNWPNDVITKYFKPFLNVKSNHARPGEESTSNSIFRCGTVTYAHTDWGKTLQDVDMMLKRRHKAQMALKDEDYDTYHDLMSEDRRRLWNFSASVQRWDYTDLLLPTVIESQINDSKFEVHYPFIDPDTYKLAVNPKAVMKYDLRDDKEYIYTYPLDKEQIEQELDSGVTDFDTWAAENRCLMIDAKGDVYSHQLLQKATETELFDAAWLKKHGWDVMEKGAYTPPLLYECSDPCVIGMDPARTSDFAAFVVIRLGELVDEDVPYDPLTGHGHTPWNNVIWAESFRKVTIRQMVERLYELKERYNLVVPLNPEKAYAIGLDARGQASGATIRDELAHPSAPTDDNGLVIQGWMSPDPIYDPMDEEYRHLATNQKAWAGLRLLWTTDQLNTDWVSYSKGQMETGNLYIAKYLDNNKRTESNERIDLGYLGVRQLRSQLERIQGEPTKYHMRYFIPGDETKLANKDDLFKAFLYAVSAMRSHQVLMSKKPKTVPQTVIRKVRPGGFRAFKPMGFR